MIVPTWAIWIAYALVGITILVTLYTVFDVIRRNRGDGGE